MDQPDDDPRELERRIQQAQRIASSITDQTTVGRLTALVEELRRKLREYGEARRTNHRIKARARELWEQSGQAAGRDLEFWLQAEAEILGRQAD